MLFAIGLGPLLKGLAPGQTDRELFSQSQAPGQTRPSTAAQVSDNFMVLRKVLYGTVRDVLKQNAELVSSISLE